MFIKENFYYCELCYLNEKRGIVILNIYINIEMYVLVLIGLKEFFLMVFFYFVVNMILLGKGLYGDNCILLYL